VPRSSARMSVPSRRYVNHVALIDFIHEPSSCSMEERCDNLMEDDTKTDSRVVAKGSIIE
jgi:hypothetical protein